MTRKKRKTSTRCPLRLHTPTDRAHMSHNSHIHSHRGMQRSLFSRDGLGYEGTVETPEADEKVGITIKHIRGLTLRADDDDNVLRNEFTSVCARTEPEASPLDKILDRVQKDIEVATKRIHAVTSTKFQMARDTSILVLGAARPLRSVLVEAMLVGGDDAADRCLDVALRVNAIAQSHALAIEAAPAREALEPIAIWLGEMEMEKNAHRHSFRLETVDRGPLVDLWAPLIDVAHVAGQTCSASLLECVRAQADTTHTQARASPCNRASTFARLIGAFVSGLIDATEEQCSHERVKACRGPARALMHMLRSHVDKGTDDDSEAPPASGYIERARADLVGPIYLSHGCRRDALGYMLALLATFDDRQTYVDDAATQKIIQMLYFGDTAHSAVFAGLNIVDFGTTIVAAARDTAAGEREPAPHQDDLLTRIWTHLPDLFDAILAHVDAWGIGSLALASRSHYARTIDAIKEDDARGDSRRLTGVALSGKVWLQRHGYGRTYDPKPKRFTPALDQGMLPGIKPLLLVCRTMAEAETVEPARRRLVARRVLATACSLNCGAAIVKCLDWMGIDLGPRTAKRIASGAALAGSLAFAAGYRASPTLMRVACTVSLWCARNSLWGSPCLSSGTRRIAVRLLVEKAVRGIKNWFGNSRFTRRQRRFGDLPGLVKFMCKFLSAMRPDIVECARDNERAIAGLRKIFHLAGMNLLAPGRNLPDAAQRAGLALALFDAVRLPSEFLGFI